MTPKETANYDNILYVLRKQLKDKVGIVSLNSIFIEAEMDDIIAFMDAKKITAPRTKVQSLEYLKIIALNYYHNFLNDPKLKKIHGDVLTYFGDEVCRYESLRKYLVNLDIISSQNLLDLFINFYDEMLTSIYNTKDISEYSIDAYITKKKPMLKTEAVFVKPGPEMNYRGYYLLVKLMEEAKKVADEVILVTTPLGVNRIGLKNLLSEMQKIKAWVYIVDPYRKRIYGLLKGSKGKFDKNLRERYMKKLPRDHLKGNKKLSFKFVEGLAFKPKIFKTYDIVVDEQHDILEIARLEKPEYVKIIRNIVIADLEHSRMIYSYIGRDEENPELIYLFLPKMDSFVSEMGGRSSILEISYEGFHVLTFYGELTKMALFLSEPGDEALKDRLRYFMSYFEKEHGSYIKDFILHGDPAVFDKDEIFSFIKKIFSI